MKQTKPVFLSTYRLQLHADFTFDDAVEIAGYLSELGISHIYASPYLQAAPGSMHGYDVVDHSAVNREVGGGEGFDRFCRALSETGLGQILDLVPNHMAISHPLLNRWWWDVLKHGPKSRYDGFFDIDRDPPEKRLGSRVLLPVLADHYGKELEAGNIRAAVMAGELALDYNGMMLPLSPDSVEAITAGEPGLAFPDPEGLAHALNKDVDRLDRLLQEQHYRIAYWRSATGDLNYRRFFAINDLAALRVDDKRVFEEIHRRVLDWVKQDLLQGLRVDHPDGLSDPGAYFAQLAGAAPGTWIIAEKILHPGEDLPSEWPVAGTTGYDFLNLAAGLLTDPAGEVPLSECYDEFTGETTPYDEIVRECKQKVMDDLLGADVSRLTELMIRICEAHRCFRDYSRSELRAALRGTLAAMPVYRTYVRTEGQVQEADRKIIEKSVADARVHNPGVDPALFGFIRDLLCRRYDGELEHAFILRFQQLSGPVTAKGIEDTAFYRYHRLSCLNEVGGDPGTMGITPADFHDRMIDRAHRYPMAMLASTTHDTKRSEDVRARMTLLSEIPSHWADTVRAWSRRNEIYRKDGLPDKNMEYLLYQTLVGAWPIDPSRARAFMEKAAREARVHTNWENPDPAYEKGLFDFVTAILEDGTFVADLAAFVAPLVTPGRINSLAQTLIKLTCPGIPDTYQGNELWDLSLVDPDNRRPVDYALRKKLLREIAGQTPEAVMNGMEQGLPKLYLTQKTLWLRKEHPGAFTPPSGYVPLPIRGEHEKHLVAYMRGEQAVVIVPRLVIGLHGGLHGGSSGDWGDTEVEIPPGKWRNVFTGDDTAGPVVKPADLLARFPVALLDKEK